MTDREISNNNNNNNAYKMQKKIKLKNIRKKIKINKNVIIILIKVSNFLSHISIFIIHLACHTPYVCDLLVL